MTDTLVQPRATETTDESGWPQTSQLPADLLEDSARRLRITALLGAFVFFMAAFFGPIVLEGRATDLFAHAAEWLPGALSIVMALLVAFATGSSWFSPTGILHLALVFQVVFSFGIAAAEYSAIYAPIQHRPGEFGGLGLSWVAVWVLLFFIVVPAPPRKALVAALASCLSVPIVVSLTIRFGPPTAQPVTPGQILVGVMFPYLLVALMAYVGARVVYQLGRDVTRAREMGSYRLTEVLGRGGMGEVWKAKHRLLRRPAAIKLIRNERFVGDDPTSRETALKRFEQEAQVTSSLRSPHTIDLFDFGVASDGSFYYVMELLEGYDFGTLIDRFGPIPEGRVIHLLLQVCHSLAEAHEHGLIHRDVKPANIFACLYGRDADFVKVLDFGLVKAPDRSSTDVDLTLGGFAGGTPAYMAPEQAVGTDVDMRTDIYSLGCVAYWLVTGHPVFEADSVGKLIADHVHSRPTPPSERVEAGVSADLEHVILQCLMKAPEERPQSAQLLSEMLASCATAGTWTPAHAQDWWNRNGPSHPTTMETGAQAGLTSA